LCFSDFENLRVHSICHRSEILDNIFDLPVVLETWMERNCRIRLLHSDYDTAAVRHREKNVQQLERNIGDTLSLLLLLFFFI